jgi:hypothetical protein
MRAACSHSTPAPRSSSTRVASGILECPCNERFGGDTEFYPKAGTKENVHKFSVLETGTCGTNAITNAKDCYTAILSIGVNATSFVNKTSNDPTAPSGCSVTTSMDGVATIAFNTATKAAACAAEKVKVGQTSMITGVTVALRLDESVGTSTMARSTKGLYCTDNHNNVLSKFDGKASGDEAALEACEKYCLGNEQCTVCSVDQLSPSPVHNQWVALPECGDLAKWGGALAGDVSTKDSAGLATITLSGSSSVWFGVGFDATVMSDSPYTLIVNESGVMEQHLGTCGSEAEHCPGNTLAPTVTVLSNTVIDGTRTVVVTRPFTGKTKVRSLVCVGGSV